MIHSLQPNLKYKVSPPHIGMIETIKEVAFYSIFDHIYCNVNHNSIIEKVFRLRSFWEKRKWFLNYSYNLRRNSISSHLECLNCVIDEHSKIFIFIGDFNAGIDENSINNFKNPDKSTSTCIDLILTNQPNLFQHSSNFETDLSDFYLLTVTDFKMGFQKLKPKIIAYRDYKNFGNAKFRYDIVTATSNRNNSGIYKSTIFNIFNGHVPIKKYIRANEAPFMSKELHKVIIKRSRLRNIFLKHRTDTNKKNYSTRRSWH